MSKNKLGRRSTVSSPWVLALTGAAVAIAISLGAATASNAAARPAAMPPAQGVMQRVVVLLRNTNVSRNPSSAAHLSAIRTQETPLIQKLRSAGATRITTGKAIPYFSASVSAAQRAALAANPAVKAVVPDETIHLGPPQSARQLDAMQAPAVSHAPAHATGGAPSICGTASKPEKDPEALSVINAQNPSYDGAGVKVAYIAGHISTTISDFQRNPKYVGSGSPAGAVVSEQNFNGDPAGFDAGDLEAFLDMSSIAAQGNVVHDLSQFVDPSHPLPSGCDLTITGDAPGATVTGLNVFSQKFNTTTSYFVQAIDWAVANNINVLNESFGANPFPDNANDAIKLVDEAAVKAGVTVVVSTGDAGVTSTDGSPATDSKLISAGASTTFRSYEQYKNGGINATTPKATNGTWLDNNISSISSGGYSQSGGNTVNLVAPGDLNWIACDSALTYDDGSVCGATNMTQEGGTSESSPLTAGAAADVISAYRATHAGHSPTPALVKTILVNTSSDIEAPAEQQGAGILNVGAAISLATTINHGSKPSATHELTFSTNQINIQGTAGSSSSRKIFITNNGKKPAKVEGISTRTLAKKVGTSKGTACLNPTSAPIACGAPTTNTFVRENGATQVYVEKTFKVPSAGKASRLNFSAALPNQDTNYSVLKVALYAPNGAYAGYSIPQGISNYANIQVTNPQAGKWTAVFFDTQHNDAEQGTVKWEADTWKSGNGGTVSPTKLTIAPGHTMSATYKVKLPATPGDTSQSIVVTNGSNTNTIPVTIRTLAKASTTFPGVLTGGNGRGNPAVQSSYAFKVPAGKKDIDVGVVFNDINDGVVAFLQDPHGNNVAQSSNLYFNGTNGAVLSNTVNVYKDHPAAGTWTLVLDWLQPVSGSAINTPFIGRVDFNKVTQTNNLPSGATIPQGSPTGYTVHYKNTSPAPQLIFLDPRQSTSSWLDLPDLFGNPEPLAFAPAGFPTTLYAVPPDSTKVFASLDATAPVTFDVGPYTGDPDLYASGGMNPTSTYTPAGGDVTPGFWNMNPSEVGPFGAGGADTTVTATADFKAWTPQFDPTVATGTSDLWSAYAGVTNPSDYIPLQVDPGQTKVFNLSITPTAAMGTTVHGTINVDDDYLFSPFLGPDAGGDQLASIPYSYKVGS